MRTAHEQTIMQSPAGFTQVAELTASDGARDFEVGWSVAVSGNTVTAGASGAAGFTECETYVFVEPSTGWANMTQTARLFVPDSEGQSVGDSVGSSNSTIAVGAPVFGTNEIASETYLYVRPIGGWKDMQATAALYFPSQYNLGFGIATAIDPTGNYVLGGSPSIENGFSGAVSIYAKPPNGWKDTREPNLLLYPPKGSAAGDFGRSVALSGNTLVVGAPFQASNGEPSSVFLYIKKGAGLQVIARLTASDVGRYDNFGVSTAISGNTVIVGAPGHNAGVGAAYIFVKPATGWTSMTQTAELTSSDATPNGALGTSVAISGGTAIVGAPGSFQNELQGAVYQYAMPAGGWANATETAKIVSFDGQPQDLFGNSVALNGTTAVIGAPLHPVNGNSEEGAVYVFAQQ